MNKKLSIYPKRILYRDILIIILSLCLSGFIISHYFLMDRLNIRERMLKSELDILKNSYRNVIVNLDSFSYDIYRINQEIDELYNIVFPEKSETSYEWVSGIINANEYINDIIYGNNFEIVASGELVDITQLKIETIRDRIEDQLCDLFYLEFLAKEREEKYDRIPSIKPILFSSIKNLDLLSGFGPRMHPIHRIVKMHTGIDFPAPIGTDIVASGSGKVIKKGYIKNGYGKYLIIDHGYDYMTLYAHLNKIDVVLGEVVKKGQRIGEVGNTGVSTSPHLHYEVRYRGVPIDPIEFCKDGLTDEEYSKLVKASKVLNRTYD
jgi:murein DD-endopeptidase MepM/ murein hydrolase activator NlpD